MSNWTDDGIVLSKDTRYRYRLWRVWDETLPRCVFILLNPATPDGVDDPTVDRCVEHARYWECGAVDVVSVFARVDPLPSTLVQDRHPVGEYTDATLVDAVTGAGVVVAAWSFWATHMDRARQVLQLLSHHGVHLHCLGTTVDGHPQDPRFRLLQPLQTYTL